MRSVSLTIAVLAGLLAAAASAEEVILMEPFDPIKAVGVWHVYQRNQNLMQKTGGAKCLVADVEPDAGGTDLFKLEARWTDPNLGDMDVTLHVVDDKQHPAQYFFQNDEHRIALSILGTDYENYVVAHGMLGLKATYFVGVRKLPVTDSIMAEVNKVLEKNKVKREFETIDHSSC